MAEYPGLADVVPAFDALLLDAKLSVPEARPGAVSRSQLIERAQASGCRVVGVTAPAGYGKSTMLAEWALAEERRVAWLSLDRFDDDPAALLTVMAATYARVSPGHDDLVADMSGLGRSVLGRAAPRLAAVLRASPNPFVLMLDDLHELQEPGCHDVLSVLIAGIPEGSQLVAASRFEQPHLARLRASGDGVEFGPNDLALDTAGTEQIFAAANVEVSRDLAATVTARAEGWPVGLYLAALIARDSDGQALTISGDDRYVADYLYRESLSRLPDADQRFLRRTAVLDQLSAPLCDAVVGERGSQGRLRRLEASSLFLMPLDRRREWYRYHGLFREFLLSELRRVEPDVVTKLHLRAADWYESNGSPMLAIEHLLNTSERDRCIQLVTELLLPTYQVGQMATVQRWLSTLGATAIEQYPPLGVLAGWVAALTGQSMEAQRWAAVLDEASFDLVPADGSASFESARAMLRSMMCAAGPDQAMRDALVGVAHEPPWSPWRDQALGLLAEAHLLRGDVNEAAVLFAEASALAVSNSNTDAFVLCESELALLAMDRGQWTGAADHVDQALATIDAQRVQDYSLSLLAFAAAARLAVHRGDLNQANRHLTSAMRGRPSSTHALPYLAVRVRLQLAKLYRAIGDPTTARHLLHEIDEILLQRPALGVLVDDVAELRGLLASGDAIGAPGGTPDDAGGDPAAPVSADAPDDP